VLGLLAGGQSTRAMAEALVVSENTLESHLRHIYEKLQVHSRSALLTRLFHETAGLSAAVSVEKLVPPSLSPLTWISKNAYWPCFSGLRARTKALINRPSTEARS
jgi:hypothetical protein